MRTSTLLSTVALCMLSVACSDDASSPADSRGGSGGASAVAGTGGAAASTAGSATGGSQSGSSAAGNASGGSDAAAGANAGSAAGGTAASAGSNSGGADMAEGGAHVIDPSLPPGQNYDLSGFALQLPIASGDSVKQITDPELQTYTSEFFYTGEDGAVMFWCPVTGATTPNSHYPRTELRERPAGGDWSITGTHRLTATFKMLKNTPSKGTIIGQIHGNATGGTSEVLKLEWTSDNKLVASVEANDNPSQQIDHVLGSYKLGTLVSYTFELENGVLDISVTDDAGTKTFSTPYTASSWAQDKYYFKLGAYVQLDTGGSALGGQVAFYSFDVQHGP